MSHRITVGFARVDATPEAYMSLGGYGDEPRRVCDHILDRLYGSCLAITDEAGETVLLLSLDILKIMQEMVDLFQDTISAKLGIPKDHIIVAATHTHSAPSVSYRADAVDQYIRFLARQLLKASEEALADREKATILAGEKTVEQMTFVRHYLMNDGKYSGPNFGVESRPSGYKAHTDLPDEQLQVVRFIREDARDILLVNWQCHATITGARNGTLKNLSADFVAPMRNHLEGTTGCHFIYFQGACGNLVPVSQIKEENLPSPNLEDTAIGYDHLAYGKTMAQHALDVLENSMHPVTPGQIGIRRMQYKAPIDHSDDHLLEKALIVREEYPKLTERDQRLALAKQYGFNGYHHACGVIRRQTSGEYREMELNALRIGDLSFATVPYEMFCSNGMYVKKNSPFPTTLMISCCDGCHMYLPDANAFTYDCYEVNVRLYPSGVAEDIPCTLVNMLNELHAK